MSFPFFCDRGRSGTQQLEVTMIQGVSMAR